MEMAQRYALERFLYRLSRSEHGTKFILKGAMLLKVWNFSNARPTMDVDLLGLTNNDSEKITFQIKEILQTEVEEDGIQFNVDSVSTQDITQQSEYVGLRILFKAKLDSMVLNIQVDMGFGDAVYPEPINKEIPPMLDFPAAQMLCYQPETSIAEKFHAMVQHNMLNSRMKDFYDIWYLSNHMAMMPRPCSLRYNRPLQSVTWLFRMWSLPFPKRSSLRNSRSGMHLKESWLLKPPQLISEKSSRELRFS